MCNCSGPAERVPADGAGHVHVAGEEGQGAAAAGAHHDRHRHQAFQQGVRQGWRGHR